MGVGRWWSFGINVFCFPGSLGKGLCHIVAFSSNIHSAAFVSLGVVLYYLPNTLHSDFYKVCVSPLLCPWFGSSIVDLVML